MLNQHSAVFHGGLRDAKVVHEGVTGHILASALAKATATAPQKDDKLRGEEEVEMKITDQSNDSVANPMQKL